MTTGRCSWVALAFLLVAPAQVFAQDGVESRVQSLEEKVQTLERRVATLEAQLRQPSASASVAQGKENWRKLEKGMSEDKVEKLLGSPSRVDATPYVITWYYYGTSAASVEFDARSGEVRGWREP